jgi:hypothetical protein
VLGIVDQYRHVNRDRFVELTTLYEGAGLDLCLEDRDEDGDVDGSDLADLIGTSAFLFLPLFAEDFGRTGCP